MNHMSKITKSSGMIKSFSYAFQGLFAFFRLERYAWYHLSIAMIVIVLAIWLPLSKIEWFVLLIVTGWVFFAEILNTSIEKLVDCIYPDFHQHAKIIKDMAAAGVLIAVFVSVIAGIMIFLPKLADVFLS